MKIKIKLRHSKLWKISWLLIIEYELDDNGEKKWNIGFELWFCTHGHQILWVVENKHKYIIARQLLKSGTSIGANIREVQGESKADFFTNLKLLIKKPKKQNIGTFMSTFYRLSFWGIAVKQANKYKKKYYQKYCQH